MQPPAPGPLPKPWWTFRPKDWSFFRHQSGRALLLEGGFGVGMDVVAPFGHFPMR
jgi:hypothetical protein